VIPVTPQSAAAFALGGIAKLSDVNKKVARRIALRVNDFFFIILKDLLPIQ
jgi:hypothetical protein